MTEPRVCSLDLTEAEAIGLLARARIGADAQQTFSISLPDGTSKHDSDRAERKLVSAVGAESNSGGNFAKLPGERVL